MILKFKFKPDYWERSAFNGGNLFIKSFNEGYQNYGIGELPKLRAGMTGTIITEKALSEMIKRKQVIILDEYIEDNDTNTKQEGLSDSGDS
jgi:hypothetical protein